MLLSRRHCRRKGHQRNLPGGGRRYAPAQSEWLSPLPRICCAIPSSGAMPSTTEPDSRGNGSPSSEALAIERAGEEATRTAICEHLGDGRAVYYTDPSRPEGTVKELPGGRRLLVRLEKPAEDSPPADGNAETVLREIEPRRRCCVSRQQPIAGFLRTAALVLRSARSQTPRACA